MAVLIGEGQVYHARSAVAAHRFRYSTFFLHFNCADEADLQRILKKRYHRLLSFSAGNYLDGKAGPGMDKNRAGVRFYPG